jgi:DNA-binding CsgD family transcriptional regulator
MLATDLGVSVPSGAALSVAGGLRIVVLGALALLPLEIAAREGVNVPRSVRRGLVVLVSAASLVFVLFAPQETTFAGDFPPIVLLPELLQPAVKVFGIGAMQATMAALVAVPAGLWWTVMRAGSESRARRAAVAGIATAPVLLYFIGAMLATWSGDAEGLAAAAWLSLGVTVALVCLGSLALAVTISQHVIAPAVLAAAQVALAPASPAAVVSLDVLTRRENEILVLLAEGRTNHEIAEKLFISKRTVDAHLRSMFRKLGVAGEGNPRVKATAAWQAQQVGV